MQNSNPDRPQTRILVAQWQAYLREQWPQGWWADDSCIVVAGEVIENDDFDPKTFDAFARDTEIQIDSGTIYTHEDDKKGVDLKQHFLKWRKNSKIATLIVEIDREKEQDLRNAILAAGGTIV